MDPYGLILRESEATLVIKVIAKRDFVCHTISKYFWTVGLDKSRANNSKNIHSPEVKAMYIKS